MLLYTSTLMIPRLIADGSLFDQECYQYTNILLLFISYFCNFKLELNPAQVILFSKWKSISIVTSICVHFCHLSWLCDFTFLLRKTYVFLLVIHLLLRLIFSSMWKKPTLVSFEPFLTARFVLLWSVKKKCCYHFNVYTPKTVSIIKKPLQNPQYLLTVCHSDRA